MFDTAAGAVLWGDALLMKRFLSQCSRSGSAETVRGYKREIREFALAGSIIHAFHEINAAFVRLGVSCETVEVDARSPRRSTAGSLPSVPCTDGRLN